MADGVRSMAIDTRHDVSAPAIRVSSTGLHRSALVGVFATTIFTSAFLLFLVQPLIGKFILPWFGGSPSVWTTCMLIFQALLFLGYGYAHALSRFSPRWQTIIHVALLIGAICTLPITPDASWKPTEIANPAWQIIWMLSACVGLPYFLLSATGPLLQSWFARTSPGVSPYRLYALSNVGSLLALVAYPFVIERWLSQPHQTFVWSAAFALFALLCSACAIFAAKSVAPVTGVATAPVDDAAERPAASTLVLWFALSMIASVFLLATTNQVCVDVAVIPFLWVIPLALYLLSFIFCFDSDRWYHRGLFLTLALVTMPIACFLTLLPANGSLLIQLSVYFTALFAACMVCHGELVRLKPASQHLTLFYMTISAGGSCGGLFVGLLSPAIFRDYYEFHLAVIGFVLLAIVTLLARPVEGQGVRVRPLLGGVCLAFWLICVAGFSTFSQRSPNLLASDRNFYGTLKVEKEITQGAVRAPRTMIHGRIVHGAQNVASSKKRLEPTTYYGRQSGIGLAFQHVNRNPDRHVGVIGLGIGTLATYGREGDRFRFYEINPAVVEFARSYFSFLPKCAAQHECLVGDARLVLEREPSQGFDLLVLDAFSGDAIPVHLLTREAFDVYLKHLSPNGLLACHVSNVHFDLRPVLAGIADEHRLATLQIDSKGVSTEFQTDATWILMARDPGDLPVIDGAKSLDEIRRTYWSDDRNNLFDVLTR
jgi:hypothetical protein